MLLKSGKQHFLLDSLAGQRERKLWGLPAGRQQSPPISACLLLPVIRAEGRATEGPLRV